MQLSVNVPLLRYDNICFTVALDPRRTILTMKFACPAPNFLDHGSALPPGGGNIVRCSLKTEFRWPILTVQLTVYVPCFEDDLSSIVIANNVRRAILAVEVAKATEIFRLSPLFLTYNACFLIEYLSILYIHIYYLISIIIYGKR